MEERKLKLLLGATAAAVTGLLVLVVLLWLTRGPSTTFFLLAGVDSAAVLVILVWASLRYYAVLLDGRRRTMSMSTGEHRLRAEYSFLRKVSGLPSKFTYEALATATDNFCALLGRGSSGSVFKGILDDGTAVAVKRIDGAEHGDREFRSEVAAIASVQHVSLVRLLGYCLVPGGPRYLVYDFVPNGSLANWIFFDPPATNGCLPWPLRYRVAVDVAKALSYLHHDCRSRVLHLDVKPENILLDEDFRALLSDFGLSKLMGRDASRVMVSTVRGTRGYLAPEWLFSGSDRGISDKSDVYSYGMVVLELVGGRRNVLRVECEGRWSYSYFPSIVAEKVQLGRTMEVVDQRLGIATGTTEEEIRSQVRRAVNVALWCIQEEAKLRPSMARVVDMLEGRLPIDDPPPQSTEGMIIMDLLGLPTSTRSGQQHPAAGLSTSTAAASSYTFAAMSSVNVSAR